MDQGHLLMNGVPYSILSDGALGLTISPEQQSQISAQTVSEPGCAAMPTLSVSGVINSPTCLTLGD